MPKGKTGSEPEPDHAKALAGFGRYAGPATLILASLADGAKHGYALTKDSRRAAGARHALRGARPPPGAAVACVVAGAAMAVRRTELSPGVLKPSTEGIPDARYTAVVMPMRI